MKRTRVVTADPPTKERTAVDGGAGGSDRNSFIWPQDRVGETVGHSTVGYPDCTQQSGSREMQPSRENRDSLFSDTANVSDVFQTATQSRGKFPDSRGK